MSVSLVRGVTPDGQVVTLKLNEDGTLATNNVVEDNSEYLLVLNSPDLIKTFNYTDVGTSDERVISVISNSINLNLGFTDTYTYDGSSGKYRIIQIERSQNA
jgi:hypothetical protein